ncbi:MAG TPA: ATP-grasp domain-containing protein [Anaerolineales bacterium]|nr:ATP-grasp domain-containing protein [Anaerolineales bacterium]HMS01142.1 ATP-grasp domain-containing protein [Anaerolineales bacterium]HNQ95380.1 ATP-grasp domain-containing protein [Anaerolineales bacterium]HNS61895.1 ATP-grasp domain-containing protein [Anaerolineales bacterium]
MANVLFTGGRAPVTLDLARAFHRAGHNVFMAESSRGHLSQPSNAIKQNFVVPAPRQETEAFLSSLKWIVEENQIELLIPTCEEVFHVVKGLESLPCRVFAEPLDKLNLFHNKWNFANSARACGLLAPDTLLIADKDALSDAFARWQRLVLKPVYSRFASRTLVLPTLREALATLTFDRTWIAQEFVPGRQFCSYSVCQEGRVVAHAVYPAIFTAGQGATIAFQPSEHAQIFQWVQTLVNHFKVTGQMAFDFIESPDGEAYALECNPRATSGVHLLTSNPRFVESFFNSGIDCVRPTQTSPRMLSSAMLIYGLTDALKKRSLGLWLKTFLQGDDVIWDLRDPLPFFLQWRSILAYLTLGMRQKISALEASTFDIEWNGE